MPNWCEQDLIVTCKSDKEGTKQLTKFVRKYQAIDSLRAEDIIPYPESYKKAEKEFKKLPTEDKERWGTIGTYWFNKHDGYNWCIENWGSKWGVSNWTFSDVDEGEPKFSFQSAWSPCLPVILALSKKYPDLVFTLYYFERGCAFNGRYECCNGEVLQHDEGVYYGERGG